MKGVFIIVLFALCMFWFLAWMSEAAQAGIGEDVAFTALVNFVYAALGFVLGIVVLIFVDRKILKAIDLVEEIREKNTAAALFAVGCVFAICYLLAHTLG